MKKIVVLEVLMMLFFVFVSAAIADTIKGPMPEKFPGPDKCAACHQIDRTHIELKQSGHSDLKCLDCHIPGAVLRKKYQSEKIAFEMLGYHQQGGNWVENKGNRVCLRCHAEKGIMDTKDKCWSCHMPSAGMDKLVIVKDKKLPPVKDNIREVKELPHRSHKFTIHDKHQ